MTAKNVVGFQKQTFSFTFSNVDPSAFNILSGLNADGSVPDGWHYEDIDPSDTAYDLAYSTRRLVKTMYSVLVWSQFASGSWNFQRYMGYADLDAARGHAKKFAMEGIHVGMKTHVQVAGTDSGTYLTIGAPSERRN